MMKIYGHNVSQPTRAVVWACRMKGIDFEFINTDPLKGKTKTPDFLANVSPLGTIPVLKDEHVSIAESGAILTYLAAKHNWGDWYPTDLRVRARIDEYLHWHHHNTRMVSHLLFRPTLEDAFGMSTFDAETKVENTEQVHEILANVERMLTENKYIAGTASMSLADIQASCEIDQIGELGLIDMSGYPRINGWMKHMESFPCYAETRRTIVKLGQVIKSKQKKESQKSKL